MPDEWQIGLLDAQSRFPLSHFSAAKCLQQKTEDIRELIEKPPWIIYRIKLCQINVLAVINGT